MSKNSPIVLFAVTDLIKINSYIIYIVTMVGNVSWLRTDNTPWSHTTVTPSPTMHGQTWSAIKNYGTLIKLLHELHVASVRYTEDCSLYRGSTVSDC